MIDLFLVTKQQSKLLFILACTLIISCMPLGIPLVHAESSQSEQLPELGGGDTIPSNEWRLGQSWLRSLRSNVRTHNDPLTRQYLHDLIYKLAPNSQLTDKRLQSIIVQSSALNAFAVPGGIIGINSGLFLYANTEQEFASVIAHELAHLSQRHYSRRVEESKVQTALSMAGILASVILAAAGGGADVGIATLAGSQAYSMQQQLSYSRQNEKEADRIGMETLAASGMDAHAMPRMFERMLRSSRFNRQIPEYLLTHPLTESRVADTASRASSYPPGDYQEDIDYYLIKSRVILQHAADPNDALAQFRMHADSTNKYLKTQSLYGQVLASIAIEKPLQAKQAMQSLLKTEGNRISVAVLYGEWLLSQNNLSKALEVIAEHLERNPGNYPLSRLLATALIKSKKYNDAIRALYTIVPIHGQEPDLWYEIAETAGLANNITELHQARAEYFYLVNNTQRSLRELRQAKKKAKDTYQQEVIDNRIREIMKESKNTRF